MRFKLRKIKSKSVMIKKMIFFAAFMFSAAASLSISDRMDDGMLKWMFILLGWISFGVSILTIFGWTPFKESDYDYD